MIDPDVAMRYAVANALREASLPNGVEKVDAFIISTAGPSPASAQGIYLDLGPNRGPRPYYRDYDEPRYMYRERYGDRGERGYYRPGRFRTFNGCQPGWTVQDGLRKPYRGY